MLGDVRKEIMTYDDIINAMKKGFLDEQRYWVIKRIKGHRKDPDCPGAWQIKATWDNDEESWEHVHIMRKDNLISLVDCAHDNNLRKSNKAKRLINKFTKLITMVNTLKDQEEGTRSKFKFGIQVPKSTRHA